MTDHTEYITIMSCAIDCNKQSLGNRLGRRGMWQGLSSREKIQEKRKRQNYMEDPPQPRISMRTNERTNKILINEGKRVSPCMTHDFFASSPQRRMKENDIKRKVVKICLNCARKTSQVPVVGN